MNFYEIYVFDFNDQISYNARLIFHAVLEFAFFVIFLQTSSPKNSDYKKGRIRSRQSHNVRLKPREPRARCASLLRMSFFGVHTPFISLFVPVRQPNTREIPYIPFANGDKKVKETHSIAKCYGKVKN